MHHPVLTDSTLQLYLAEVRKFPLLDAAEEYRLAVAHHDHGDLDAAHRLVTSNLRFVLKICAEYRNYGMRLLDLVQEGNIGLMRAVKKFNPHRGTRLITYAAWWIRAHVHEYIIANWSLLKIGTTQAQKKLFFKLRQAIGDASDGDAMDAAASQLMVAEAEVVEMEQRLRGELSLDIKGEDGLTMAELLVDDALPHDEVIADAQIAERRRVSVTAALGTLDERERFIAEQRLASDEPLTLQELSDRLAISRERVRQVEIRVREKLKLLLEPCRAA